MPMRRPAGIAVPPELFDLYEREINAAQGRAIWVPDESAPGSLFLFRDVREVKDLTLNTIATLGMRVSMDRIVENCVEPFVQMNMPLLCAIDFQGHRVYAADDRLLNLNGDAETYSLRELEGETYFCAVHTPASSQWTYTAALPYGEILQSLRSASSTAAVIAAVALVLALLFASLLWNVDVPPALLLFEDHMAAGCFPDGLPAFETLNDPALILQLAQCGALLPWEATSACHLYQHPFETSQAEILQRIRHCAEKKKPCMLVNV